MIGSSVKVLKDMTHNIGNELDEQSVWVDHLSSFTYLLFFLFCGVVVITAVQVENQFWPILFLLRFLVYWNWIRVYRVPTGRWEVMEYV